MYSHVNIKISSIKKVREENYICRILVTVSFFIFDTLPVKKLYNIEINIWIKIILFLTL